MTISRKPKKAEEPIPEPTHAQAIRVLAGTVEGKVLFQYMAGPMCAQHESSLVLDPTTKEINTLASIYNEARRSLYLDIRKFIPAEELREIENPIEAKE